MKSEKKIKLNTKVKVGSLSVLSLAVLLLGGLIYIELTSKKVMTQDYTLYQYTCQPAVNYSVHIIDNIIYDSNVLEEGMDYSKNLLDYIEAKFTIEFQGSEAGQTELDYHITARVRGYKEADEGKAVNWTKKYELKEATKVETSEQYLLEEASVPFDLAEYDDFAIKANEILGMSLSSEVVVSLEGNLIINTPYGTKTSPINLNLTIPLAQNNITIVKDEIPVISDNIIETKEIVIPVDYNKVTLYSIGIGACAAIILILLLITKAPSVYDLRNSNARKLLKNYSSRIVSINSKTEENFSQTYVLSTMADLIKVADEIEKPIYYIYDEFFLLGNYSFHVTDGEHQYIYRLAGEAE